MIFKRFLGPFVCCGSVFCVATRFYASSFHSVHSSVSLISVCFVISLIKVFIALRRPISYSATSTFVSF